MRATVFFLVLGAAIAIGAVWYLERGRALPAHRVERPAAPLGPAGPYPPRAAHRAPRSRELPAGASEKAAKLAQSWQRELASRDPARRRAALDALLAGVGSGDSDRALAAMYSLYAGLHARKAMGGDLKALRAELRPRILHQLDSPFPEVRAAALGALQAAGVERGDFDRLLELARDASPRVRARAAGAIRLALPPRRSERAAQAALALANDPDPLVVRAAIGAFGGKRLGAAWEARMIELSRNPHYTLDVIRAGLGPMPNKSDTVLGLLLQKAASPDPALKNAALAALRQGVPSDRRPKVAAEVLRIALLPAASAVRNRCLRLLAAYGGPGELEGLRRLKERRDLSAGTRKELARALAAIERRQ